MQIDWDKALEEILTDKVTCRRCGSFAGEMVAGYTREPWGAEYAPRCQLCTRREDCDARKLVVLCESCAREVGLRVRRVDDETLMVMLFNDCRKDLEDSLEYLAEYWQEDLEVPPEEVDKRLEEFSPDAYAEEDEGRRKLEEEYLTYHRWFRERGIRIPDPAWRAGYVEEIIALGYTTTLGE